MAHFLATVTPRRRRAKQRSESWFPAQTAHALPLERQSTVSWSVNWHRRHRDMGGGFEKRLHVWRFPVFFCVLRRRLLSSVFSVVFSVFSVVFFVLSRVFSASLPSSVPPRHSQPAAQQPLGPLGSRPSLSVVRRMATWAIKVASIVEGNLKVCAHWWLRSDCVNV